jgi:hypothetical protein
MGCVLNVLNKIIKKEKKQLKNRKWGVFLKNDIEFFDIFLTKEVGMSIYCYGGGCVRVLSENFFNLNFLVLKAYLGLGLVRMFLVLKGVIFSWGLNRVVVLNHLQLVNELGWEFGRVRLLNIPIFLRRRQFKSVLCRGEVFLALSGGKGLGGMIFDVCLWDCGGKRKKFLRKSLEVIKFFVLRGVLEKEIAKRIRSSVMQRWEKRQQKPNFSLNLKVLMSELLALFNVEYSGSGMVCAGVPWVRCRSGSSESFSGGLLLNSVVWKRSVIKRGVSTSVSLRVIDVINRLQQTRLEPDVEFLLFLEENVFVGDRRSEFSSIIRNVHEGGVYYSFELDFRMRIYPMNKSLHPIRGGVVRSIFNFSTCAKFVESSFKVYAVNQFSGHVGLSEKDLLKIFETEVGGLMVNFRQRKVIAFILRKAKKPFLFLRCCFEYERYGKRGSGFRSFLPIYFDATGSGLQIISMFFSCLGFKSSLNLVEKGLSCLIGDIYAEVVQGCGLVLSRKIVKRAVLIRLYGGGYRNFVRQTNGEKFWRFLGKLRVFREFSKFVSHFCCVAGGSAIQWGVFDLGVVRMVYTMAGVSTVFDISKRRRSFFANFVQSLEAGLSIAVLDGWFKGVNRDVVLIHDCFGVPLGFGVVIKTLLMEFLVRLRRVGLVYTFRGSSISILRLATRNYLKKHQLRSRGVVDPAPSFCRYVLM